MSATPSSAKERTGRPSSATNGTTHSENCGEYRRDHSSSAITARVWSDVLVTYLDRGLAQGAIPYWDAFFDYPPGIGYLAALIDERSKPRRQRPGSQQQTRYGAGERDAAGDRGDQQRARPARSRGGGACGGFDGRTLVACCGRLST